VQGAAPLARRDGLDLLLEDRVLVVHLAVPGFENCGLRVWDLGLRVWC